MVWARFQSSVSGSPGIRNVKVRKEGGTAGASPARDSAELRVAGDAEEDEAPPVCRQAHPVPAITASRASDPSHGAEKRVSGLVFGVNDLDSDVAADLGLAAESGMQGEVVHVADSLFLGVFHFREIFIP